jgi:small neutral amino acid transporter SnatA (MarC family)
MVAIIVGLIFIAFAVFAVLPGALNWGQYVLDFLKGSVPVIALFVGLIAVFIGIADIKDRIEAKKEEEEEKKEAAKETEKKE